MSTFYCVCTSCDERGHISAHIINSVEAEAVPESTRRETASRIMFFDWYSSKEEAEQAARNQDMYRKRVISWQI